MASAAEMTEAIARDTVVHLHRRRSRVDAGGEAGGDPLAAVMTEIFRVVAADDIALVLHEEGGGAAPQILFAKGAILHRSEIDRLMLEAAQSTAEAEPLCPPIQWKAGDDPVEHGLMTASIAVGDATMTITAFFRRGHESVRNHARKALGRMMPMVQAFFQLWWSRERAAAKLRGFTAALDRGGVATMLVDRNAHLVFANTVAQDLVSRNDGLRLNGDSLSCTRLADTLRLHAAIEHVADDAPVRPGAAFPCPVLSLRRDRRRPLMAAIVPGDPRAEGAARTAAVIYLFDPDRCIEPLLNPVCKHYGLSPVEAKLTCLLAGGTALGEAAKIMHVQEQTARSYLKQIFLKTDTNRQAELVSLVLASAVQTAPDCRPGLV